MFARVTVAGLCSLLLLQVPWQEQIAVFSGRGVRVGPMCIASARMMQLNAIANTLGENDT